MYERLDKLREDVKRSERRLDDARNRLKQAEERLKEAENSQILQNVEQLKLTPEQLAEVLAMAKAGKFGRAESTDDGKTDAATVNDEGNDYDPDLDERDTYVNREDKEDEE